MNLNKNIISFVFSIFQIRMLRLRMFAKLSWVTQQIYGRIEVLIQEIMELKDQDLLLGIVQKIHCAVREP